MNLIDQTASLNLAALTLRLRDLLLECDPQTIVTHPDEGGRPDHDSTAFAVHTAVASLETIGAQAPTVVPHQLC
jgi:LmbE family N-acetylglucosaminyl deacetylase